jgi:PiT family inorganic phosphate transporter
VSCYTAISLGTLFGGWRIVKTMGQKITKLKPVGGFCAETGGAITVFIATFMGIPVSTTHTGPENVGRTLGRGGQHRLGVDLYHSGVRVHGGGGVVDRQAHPVSDTARL